MYPFSISRAENPESMLADEHDADDDESGSDWIFPNGESNYYYYIYKYIYIYIYIHRMWM